MWVFEGDDITLDTLELAGAASAGNQGAAVYMAGKNLTVLNSYIHDNQEGLTTTANAKSQILIQATEFERNGFGDGLTHNIDVGRAARFIIQDSYSHTAVGGDLVRSEALENYILFNRITSEQGGTRTEIDLPRGGRSFLIGNVIEKGPNDVGNSLVEYLIGGDGSFNPSSELYVFTNTLISNKSTGVDFLDIGAPIPIPVVAMNNIFSGNGTIRTQSNSESAKP